jgi:hypothetical protein
MMNCQIVEKLPAPEEYNQLRQSVGWGIYECDVILQALPNSLYCVCAVSDGEIIGMARTIGDGGIAYISKMSSSNLTISSRASARS